jgi:hypothetical protein
MQISDQNRNSVPTFLNLFKSLFSPLHHKSKGMKNIFDHHFFEQKYFLQPSASENDFANRLNISLENLNQISKTFYFRPFSYLIEEHRYQHFMKEFENPINADLPFESIIKLSGFENNDSFIQFVHEKRNKTIK